jgi:carboxyl-terminal processing protease
MISSITLALIGLNSVPAIAQRDVCDYERRNNSGKDGYDEARYGNEDGHQDRYDRSSNYEYERNPRHLPAYSEERLRERDEYLSRSHDYDRFDRGYDSSGHQSSAGTNRSRFRPTSFERYRDNDTRTRRDLSDPFRTQRRQYNDSTMTDTRYRIPLRDNDRLDYGQRDLDYGLGRVRDRDSRDLRDYDRIDPGRGLQSSNGYDPLTPPLPRRDGGNEAEALTKRITARFQNPTTVRTIRSLSSDQALQLYREVSTQTDARHLEPSTYDLRVRRALRNLGLVLDNQSATQALGISQESFKADGFRDSLSRIWDGMNVQNKSDAEQVMRTVMQQAQQVQGIAPGLVAFEFSNATIDTLDKFSALEPSEPTRGPSAALESEMVGIGIEVKLHNDGLLLMRALRGGPAAEAGLESGDVITAINRRSITGMAMAQSVDLIKGRSGSQIQMQVTRSGRNSKSVTLTRRRYRVWSVNDVKMVSGSDVGYLNLSQFAQTSTQEIDLALQQLHNKGMKSLVVDLRGNPGGLLTTCVQITNRFLPCGTIVSTKGRLNADNMHESATYSRTWNTPLVVLVDRDSASASEIFAAAIQDNERGIVVGEKSYGKGTVQTHFPLQSINGNLRLTTARFYAPSGRAMSGNGVTPDVQISDEDGVANGDRVLSEAVRIAQSRQLEAMATNSEKCRIKNGPLQRNSFNGDMFDAVNPRTVLR